MNSILSFLDSKNLGLQSSAAARSDSDPVEQQWKEFTRFYQENEKVLKACESVDILWAAINDKVPELEIAINSFPSTAHIVVEGLVRLANLQPLFSVAVSAYHSLIALHLKAASGHMKVLFVLLQMQAMMCTLFHLRNVRTIYARTETQKTSLQRLDIAIATDIIHCGSDLNYFLNLNSAAKRIYTFAFEQIFAGHIVSLLKLRQDLFQMLVDLDLVTVSMMWGKIKDLGKDLISRAVNGEKRQRFLRNFFIGLRTQEESKAAFLIETKTANRMEDPEGAKKGVVETYMELIHTLDDFEQVGYVGEAIAETLRGKVNEKAENHRPYFKKLLRMQDRVLERKLLRKQQQIRRMRQFDMKVQMPLIVSIPSPVDGSKKLISLDTANIVLEDPDVHRIWTRMNFGPSVTIQDFILRFRDYAAQEESNVNDKWILDYVNLAHVWPMAEALDISESGSQFVDARKIHDFALSRPDGLTNFSDWLAYWAAGWRINIMNYRDQIYAIICQMHVAYDSVLIANKAFVGGYFESPFFIRIESLFRHITLSQDGHDTSNDPRLVKLAYYVAHLQEEEIIDNLTLSSYTLETATEATFVGGPGKVETWILPLLYLLLQRHLAIIEVAQSYVLDESEMRAHSQSFVSTFKVFENRIKDLAAIFKLEEKNDAQRQFEICSYGMFHTYIDKQKSMSPKLYTMSAFRNVISPPKHDKLNKGKINISILSKGLGQSFKYQDVDRTLPDIMEEMHTLAGTWYGSTERPLQINIKPFSAKSHRFTGQGETYTSQVEVTGGVEPDTGEDSHGRLRVYFNILSSDADNLLFQGHYNMNEDTIEGEIGSYQGDDDDGVYGSTIPLSEPSEPAQRKALLLTRTPPAISRFKYLLSEPSVNPTWSLARRRWAFATEAVLYQAQTKMQSSKIISRGLQDRRSWSAKINRTGIQPAKDSVEKMLVYLPAENVRLYTNLAQYLLNREADSL